MCYILMIMKAKSKSLTDKNLNLLLAGKHPKVKKFAGKHVMVVENEISLLREGKDGLEDMKRLEEKHGQTPTVAFVPRPGISYILFSWK